MGHAGGVAADLRIDPAAPVAGELSRIAVELLDGAVADLDPGGSRRPGEEGVHEARKALKRLRSVVRLGRDLLGRERAREENHAYRDLAHLLAGRRDAAAMVEAVERLQDAADPDDAELAASLARLHARARRGIGDGDGSAEDGATEQVLDGLVDARRRALTWSGGAGTGWRLIESGFVHQYRRGRHALESLGEAPSDEELHDWRKRVKDHWHHLQLLEAAWPPVVKATAKQTHVLSDLLGDDHDLAELAARFGPTEGSERAGDGLDDPVRRLVAAERQRLQTEARALGGRVFAEPPKRLGARFGAWWPEP